VRQIALGGFDNARYFLTAFCAGTFQNNVTLFDGAFESNDLRHITALDAEYVFQEATADFGWDGGPDDSRFHSEFSLVHVTAVKCFEAGMSRVPAGFYFFTGDRGGERRQPAATSLQQLIR
jgi:hypothetical protein